MKKLLSLLTVIVFIIGCAGNSPKISATGELDYGDYTSETLTTNAWEALKVGDFSIAIKYTEKVTELYEDQAHEMQAYVKSQPATRSKKSPDQIHANWALNDVGTSYFIRGEALLKLDRNEEALAAYQAVTEHFYLAQTWDPKGWFWSPSEAAMKKVTMLSDDF